MGFGVKSTTVFSAFRAKQINFAPAEIPGRKYMFEVSGPDGEDPVVEYIPPELGRREPQRLADLYDIPLAWFYNPLLIPGEENDKPPS